MNSLATRDDIRDLHARIDSIASTMVTRDAFDNIASTMATRDALDAVVLNMATRSDIRMLTQIGLGIISTLIVVVIVLIGTSIIN